MIRPFELAALAVALVVGLAGARWMDAGHLFLACEVLTLFLMAQMWNLLAGYGGQVSLGHQVFVGLGAYALFVTANATALPLWLVLALVPLAVGLAAIPLGMVMFHLKAAYFAVGMWVVAEIVRQLALMVPFLPGSAGLTLRPGGRSIQGYPEQMVFVVALVAAVAVVVGLRLFLRSRAGLATLALRDNEAAARAAGVNVRALHLALFCVTAAGCAGAGALYYITTLYVTASDAFQINWIVAMMVVTVIGGTGTLAGPALGCVILIGLREGMTAAGFSGDQYWIVMGFLSVLVLLVSPRGLWPALAGLAAKFTKG